MARIIIIFFSLKINLYEGSGKNIIPDVNWLTEYLVSS